MMTNATAVAMFSKRNRVMDAPSAAPHVFCDSEHVALTSTMKHSRNLNWRTKCDSSYLPL